MGSMVEKLTKNQLISPPSWVQKQTQYEVMMGSIAYGVSNDISDVDIYGFCIPPKDMIFPHLVGEIQGFGRQKKRFEQFQQHHITDPNNQKEYDITIYSIIKYFQLVMENNPNMIDSLFVPQRCVLHCTPLANIVRENKKEFLHKGAWFKFKGYAFSQMNKMKTKNPDVNSKRYESVQKHGYDLKFAYHLVRLLNEIEMILIEHDLDLERNREQLKIIRQGEWSFNQVVDYFHYKEKSLEELYTKSDLRHTPNESKIKNILLNCLEHHFGSLDNMVVLPNRGEQLLIDLRELLDKYSS